MTEHTAYTQYLIKFRKLSWNQFTALMDAERDKPETNRHASFNDPEFHRACDAFTRHMCPTGGGRGRTPKALAWDSSKGDYVLPG